MLSPDLIESILEGTPDPIFVKSFEGRLVLVNSACARVLGHPKEWLIGKTAAEFLGTEFAPSVDAVDRRVMSTGIIEVVEQRIMQGGKVSVFLTTKSAWRDADGRILGMIGVARDITDRKRTEQVLRESQDRLNLALQAGQMGTWDYDLTTGRLEWSDGHYRLFGLRPGERLPTSVCSPTGSTPQTARVWRRQSQKRWRTRKTFPLATASCGRTQAFTGWRREAR